jgi:GT2 family glycosyltransferase
MTQPSTSPRQAGNLVTAVLVCHDGAQWLPEVLEGLAAQTRPPDRYVVVDVGSVDDSIELVTAVLADATYVSVDRSTRFATAVQAALAAAPDLVPPQAGALAVLADESGAEDPGAEWIWLLHDDAAPSRFALEELLERVAGAPSVWMVGPKVRGWDGARLLEAGISINATGYVDTRIDGVELDQGQRDEADEVLAVGTACCLVRREAWTRLGGLDPTWPTYADDADIGWRINSAGGRVVVESRAVVRHARAQSVGRRVPVVHTGRFLAGRRRSGMQVVLANTSAWLVPLLVLRYLLAGPLRALGLLVLSRRPAAAGAELLALGEVLIQPHVILAARRRRSKTREVTYRELRPLLPSASSRWRSSPFRIGWLSDRVTTARRSSSSETGPVSEESESMDLDESAIARFVRRPSTVLFVAMSVLALIAERRVLGSALHGGRLLPAPAGASDLWSTYTSTFHPSGTGSVTVAPTWIGVMALLSTVALGKAWLIVDLIVLGVVPLSALSAYTAARGLTAAVQVRVWAAIAYSLLPAVTGAVAGGRIDVAVAAILLPQVIRAGAAALQVEPGQWRSRRAVGAGLLLALTCAFAPMVWPLAALALVVGVAFAGPAPGLAKATLWRAGNAVVMLTIPIALLLPWSLSVIAHPSLLVDGAGLPEFVSSHQPPSGLSLVLLHAGGPDQPMLWIGLPILAAAMFGLTRASRVAAARVGAALLLAGIAVGVGMTRASGVTAGLPGSRHWPGLVLLVAGSGAILMALVAAVGARPALQEQNFGWRQPVAVVVVLLALVATAVLAVGWLVGGVSQPLTTRDPAVLPLFAQSQLVTADTPTSPRGLVVAAAGGPTITYSLLRRPQGPVLGDADTAPPAGTVAASHLATAVQDLVAGRPGASSEIASFGIAFVVARSASVSRVQLALGRNPTLTVLPSAGATVWRSSIPAGELAVLNPVSATKALAGSVPTAPASALLPASPGSADVTIGGGVTGRVAVLAEPSSSHWTATLNGHALVKKTAYGWAQAFELPTTGGRLVIGYHDEPRHVWLWLELALVLVALGAALPVRRVDDLDTAV